MICSACGKDIGIGETVAKGPDGDMHYRCFKRGTAHGKEITLATLSEELGALKRRVQQLEQRLTDDERDIPFRVGGGSS